MLLQACPWTKPIGYEKVWPTFVEQSRKCSHVFTESLGQICHASARSFARTGHPLVSGCQRDSSEIPSFWFPNSNFRIFHSSHKCTRMHARCSTSEWFSKRSFAPFQEVLPCGDKCATLQCSSRHFTQSIQPKVQEPFCESGFLLKPKSIAS